MAPRSVFDCFEATKRPTQTSHPAKTSIERAAKPPRCPMDRRNFSAANKVILFVVKGSFFSPSFSHLFRSSPFWLVETLGYPVPFTGEAPWLLYEMAMNIMNWGSTFHFHTRLKWIWWWQGSWWVTCLLHTEKHNGVWSRIQSEYQVCYQNYN
jgi:hypothetical protein